MSVPHTVGIIVLPDIPKVSVRHVPDVLTSFPAPITSPFVCFPIEAVLVEGPVMTNESKSKRI